jgi:uncharacterized protein
MKVTIDTNALVNASGDDHSYANRILDEVLAGKVESFANVQTVRENRLIVDRKVNDPAFRQKLEDYFSAVQLVEGEYLDVVEDPEDNKILASAVAAGVDYLITSDWHLLKIAEYEGVRIVTPQGFWAEYESETGQGWQDWVKNFMN